jgi:adenylate cyclase
MSGHRKLAAILVADIVGSSRMMGSDEERTVARIRALRGDLVDPAVAAHAGRIVKGTGDGVIAEFHSVLDATRCAVEIQNGLAERNAGVTAEKRIDFRIGVHVGDVVEELDGDLMGDGVNVAARLQEICDSGGVCLSEDAHRQIHDSLRESFVDLGEHTLKNIDRPVRAYGWKSGPGTFATRMRRGAGSRWMALAAALVVVVSVAGLYGLYGTRVFVLPPAPTGAVVSGPVPREDSLAHAPRLSIVVLPFVNLSGDPEQDYFADALTDDLTTDLSHLSESFVIARNTAFTYKGKSADAKQIGRDLGVRYALEGSVRRLGDTITINAQLVATETGAHIWADRFQGDRSKLGELQVEAVARIANALGVQLVNAEALRAMRERPTDPNSADLVMRGWAAFNQGFTVDNLNRAVDEFVQALRLDPDNIEALIGKAIASVARLYNYGVGDYVEVKYEAEQAANRVLSVQPGRASAHMIRVLVFEGLGRYDAALAEARAAIANDRNFAAAYSETGFILTVLGRAEEAFAPIEQALRLSPRDPTRNVWEWHACHAHAHLAQWNEVIEWCGKSIASNPSYFAPHIELAAAYGWLGRSEDAHSAVSEIEKLRPGFTVENYVGGPDVPADAKYKAERARIAEGLRKAGLPESSQAATPVDNAKWCAGVKIAVIVEGWSECSGDMLSPMMCNGSRQAALDLGPTVSFSYAQWDSGVITSLLQRAIDAKVDGVVVPGFPGDPALDDLIDKAFAQGTIVTTSNVALPEAEKRYSSQGLGYAGVDPHSAGVALAEEAVKRARVKSGDAALVWGHRSAVGEHGKITEGMIDALNAAGVRVIFIEGNVPEPKGPSGDALAAALKANPDLKLVLVEDPVSTSHLGFFLRDATLKPGQIYTAGFGLLPLTAREIRDGYLNLVFDSQDYLHGYLPILSLCLTKKYSFSGLHFETDNIFIDRSNLPAFESLIEKSIR